MAGVIDDDGQWERCNKCGKFILIQDLRYEKPTPEFDCGRDLCAICNGEIVLNTKGGHRGYNQIGVWGPGHTIYNATEQDPMWRNPYSAFAV